MPLEAIRIMGQAEFLAWAQDRDQRHELVDGVPVAMAGAKRRHDQIVVNTIRELATQLRGAACRPFTADTAVRIPAGNVRLPDAGVDCGTFRDETNWADEPMVVIEVLSASTRDFDLFGKVEEYKTVPSLRHVVIVDPDEARAVHWSRTVDGTWSFQTHEGQDAAIVTALPLLTLRLADLYEGLAFAARPRLVESGR